SHLSSNPSAGSTPPPSAVVPRRSPVVYPALLSRVAEAFKTRISLSERVKDGLVYSDTFDGRDAVDKISYIIKTTDRNLALLLGRALDAQKFFHDVTYDHRLRDSPAELYQFRERLSRPFLEEEGGGEPAFSPVEEEGRIPGGDPAKGRRMSVADTIASEESSFPSGVFTLLTDCYSPTCTRDRLCYSIACPRRLEQQARLNLKPKPGFLQRSLSSDSLADDFKEPGSLWIHSVPQDIADSTSDAEKKRQECLNEVFYTERDFVRDMEYLRDSWIKPLRSGNIIPEERREDFVTQVFWNVLEIYSVNVRLADMLNKRQKYAHVVDKIGDIFLDMVPHFGPFVKYGAHQLYGKYEFEKEKAANPAFAKFVDETERRPESRKLELNGYLTKPTTRLARYPLLLEACLKHTADDNPDKLILPKVVKLVREFLAKVNVETGKSENRFNLAQLDQQLVFKNGEAVDLRLRDEDREMIYKGPLKKRGGTQSESAELTVYLFDHAILMVKQKSKNEQSKVYRKPIPLELLVVAPLEESVASRGGAVRPKSLISRGSNPKYPANPPPGVDKHSKNGFAITFIHLGRRGYQITLWSASWAGRKKWLEKIEGRQLELRDRSLVFETRALSAGYFVGTNRVTCAAPFDNGNRMVYGTDNGVYLSDLRDNAKVPVKVISVPNVTQLDVLEEQGILIVLADKAVQTFFVDNLDPGDAVGAAKRARKISSHATFFKAGQCLNRTLVCVVKSGSVSSTIKTLEPIAHDRNKKQGGVRKFLQGSNEALRVFKEFYIPTESSSVHFLKSKLCVGCTKGFEIVDLETLDTQGLLDPADSSLDFVQKRESARPIAIYRVDGDFLLCYDEFAFYVNKNGWRAKSNWIIQWEGMPTTFGAPTYARIHCVRNTDLSISTALHYPYVLAFEPTFVEVRHVESGALMQIIPGNSLRCLFADTPPSASSAASAGSYFPSHYSGYGHPPPNGPRYPHGLSVRTEIIIADADRVFSPCGLVVRALSSTPLPPDFLTAPPKPGSEMKKISTADFLKLHLPQALRHPTSAKAQATVNYAAPKPDARRKKRSRVASDSGSEGEVERNKAEIRRINEATRKVQELTGDDYSADEEEPKDRVVEEIVLSDTDSEAEALAERDRKARKEAKRARKVARRAARAAEAAKDFTPQPLAQVASASKNAIVRKMDCIVIDSDSEPEVADVENEAAAHRRRKAERKAARKAARAEEKRTSNWHVRLDDSSARMRAATSSRSPVTKAGLGEPVTAKANDKKSYEKKLLSNVDINVLSPARGRSKTFTEVTRINVNQAATTTLPLKATEKSIVQQHKEMVPPTDEVSDDTGDEEFIRSLAGKVDVSKFLNRKPSASTSQRSASTSYKGLPAVTSSPDGELLFNGSSLRDWFAHSKLRKRILDEFLRTQGMDVRRFRGLWLTSFSDEGFSLKLGDFTPSEDALLDKALDEWAILHSIDRAGVLKIIFSIKDTSKDAFWYHVTRPLTWRTQAAVVQHLRFINSPGRHSGAWSEEEHAALANAVRIHGTAWSVIEQIVGRPAMICRNKWIYRKKEVDDAEKTPWTQEQISFLRKAVAEFGERSWSRITREHELIDKTAEQCRHKWTALKGSQYLTFASREVLAASGVNWLSLQTSVPALERYSEHQLLSAWKKMSRAAESAGVSSENFQSERNGSDSLNKLSTLMWYTAQLQWAVNRYHLSPKGKGRMLEEDEEDEKDESEEGSAGSDSELSDD
ncbi:RHO1 GDP-GTP exchange protein 1/2, partial [Phenoliferia sp. Uapishka_3]